MQKFVKTAKVLAILTLTGLISACSVVIPSVFPLDDLPAPTGPHQVGSQVIYWTDESRDEWFTEDASDKRRLVVQIWYPTSQQSGETMDYLLNADRRIPRLAAQLELWSPLIDHMRSVKTNAYRDAPLALSETGQPRRLLVFSHGLGGTRNQNAVQAEELASHGYVVMSTDHAYDSYFTIFEDGSTADYRSRANGPLTTEEFWAFRSPQLATRAADVRFMLDRVSALNTAGDTFWRHVGVDHVGVFGHSYGGATSIMAASSDSRIGAVIALDGWMLPVPEEKIDAGLSQPFLYLGQSSWTDPINYQKLDRMMAANKGVSRKRLLAGSIHGDFSDTPQFSSRAKRFGLIGDIPREELRVVLNDEIRSFFDTHVKTD